MKISQVMKNNFQSVIPTTQKNKSMQNKVNFIFLKNKTEEKREGSNVCLQEQ